MVQIIIPFKIQNPKTRLSSLLSLKERTQFVKSMLLDVLDVASVCTSNLFILSTDKINFINPRKVTILVDTQPLNDAINSILEEEIDEAIAIVMSDLPLLNPSILENFLSSEGDVVIAPGKKGGTNMILVRNKNFRTSYHYGSFFNHLEIARKMGLKATVFDSYFSGVDIDEECDIIELLMHGSGLSKKYLESLGFFVDFTLKDPILGRK